MLLFLALRMMTGAFWPSAMVAALFAIHPLRAESVAWAAERKDVLERLVLDVDHAQPTPGMPSGRTCCDIWW